MMKAVILKCMVLFGISWILGTTTTNGQTTITFNELTNYLSTFGETYDNSGFRFSVVKSGSATTGSGVKANENGGFGGSVCLSDSNFEIGGITGWTIKRVDGNPFQFISIFLQVGVAGASTNGTVTAYKNNVQIGSPVNTEFNSATTGLKDFSGNPDFFDVDEIRIEADDIYLFLDHVTHGPPLTVGDEDPPEVTGILVQGNPPTTATSVIFSVNFSKNALNVSADDFELTTSGTSGTIGTVTGSGSNYSVTVNDLAGEGTVRLDLKSGTNITNEDGFTGVAAYNSGQLHTVSACFTENFENETDGQLTFSGNGLDFSLSTGMEVESRLGFGAGSSNRYLKNNNSAGTFSIASADLFTMNTVDIFLSDLSNGDNPTASGSLMVKGKRDGVEVFSIIKTSGFPTNTALNSGFFTLNFTTDGIESFRNANIDELELTISDGFVELLIDNFNFCEEVSDIDTQAPAVQRIIVTGSPASTATSVNFEVLFDENANNVSLDDFTLYTTGTATGNLINLSGSGNTYQVTVDEITGEGSIQLRLNGGTDIADNLGNSGPFAFLNGAYHLVGSCYIETFEDETNGATNFAGNGKDFTLDGTWAVKRQDRFGANASDFFLENNGTGTGNYTINATSSPVAFSQVALYLSSFTSGIEPTNDGTLIVTGKLDGTTLYSISKNSGFPDSFGSTAGFFTLDFAADGLEDFSDIYVDELEFQLGSNFTFIALDNLEFCSDVTPPAGYSVLIDQSTIDLDTQTAISFTLSNAEIGTTYNYAFSSDQGGTPITGSGIVAAEDQQVTGLDLSGLENGTVILTVTLTDLSGNEGAEATDTAEKSVNNPPLISPNLYQGPDYSELGTPVQLASGITVTDLDGDNIIKATIRFVAPLKLDGDVLVIPDPSPYTLTVIDENEFTLEGTGNAASMTSVLRTLAFSSTSKDPTETGANMGRRIAITVEDENGAVSTLANNSHNIELGILATNDAPEITFPGIQSLVENEGLEFSVANGNPISVFDADAGDNFLEISLTATEGTLSTNGTAGLNFITGDGTEDVSMVFTGSQTNINQALEGLVFNPDTDFVGPASIQLTSDDQGNTGAGGALSATETISIEIAEAFTVETQNILVDLDVNGQVSISPEDVFLSSNQTNLTLSLDNSIFDCTNIGPNTVTMSATNESGDIATAEATVTVRDTIQPVALTQNITVQLDPDGNAEITPDMVDNGSNDACGIANRELGITQFDCGDTGDNTVTLTVTDNNGNTTSAQATVTVEDNVAPVALAQNITVQLDVDGNVEITPDMVDNGSNDACGIADRELDITQFGCGDIGNNIVTLTVTDNNGNTATAQATVTVEDNVAPVALAQNITIQLDTDGNAEITPDMVDNGSNDACGIADRELDITQFDCGDTGDNTVTLTVTDNNGNTTSAQATVTVEDNVAPVALAQNITVQLDVDGNVEITPDMVDNGSNDACGIADRELDITQFGCGDIGNNIVTLTVTDNNGNTATAQATVTVEDNVAPVALAQNITIQLDADGNAEITADMVDNGSNDACGIFDLELDISQFGCGDVGDNTVTLSVTDNNGNTATAQATVTVEDNVAPVALVQNITVQLDDDGNAEITPDMVDNGSNDACGIANLELDITQFGCGEIGDNTVTLTVTDNHGNTETAQATVTVEDNVAPVALVQNITVQLDADGNAEITPDMVDNGSNDACGIADRELDITQFGCGDIGDNIVTLTVTDNHGNTETAQATVTVEDNVAPVAVAQNFTVQLDPDGNAEISADMVDNGSNDACGIADLELDISQFGCGDVGDNTVTLSVTDNNGNTETAQATVTVEDNVAPVALAQNITVQLDPDGNAEITPDMVDNGSNDACGIANRELDITQFGCGDIGDNTVTLTVTDNHGNTETAQATVTVEDNVAPVALAQNITVQLDPDGNAEITPDMVDNGSNDACGIANRELDITQFGCGDIGDNTVTLTVTDNHGNTETAQATVTVEDVTPPVPILDVLPEINAECNLVYLEAPVGMDQCNGEIVAETGTEWPIRETTLITWSFVDAAGNSSTLTQQVNITDSEAPQIENVPADFEVILDETGTYQLPDFTQMAIASDNCNLVSFVQTPSAGTLFSNSGEVEINLEVEDSFGNTNSESFTITLIDRSLASIENPSLITVPWNTGIGEIDLPESLTIILQEGGQELVPVTWDLTGYGPLLPGLYQLPGELQLGNILNPDALVATLTILVEDKLSPTNIDLSGQSFPANSIIGSPVGTFTTEDSQDDQHVYTLDQGQADNRHFLISGNELIWNSRESLPGKTEFTIIVRSTDRMGNSIDSSFTLQRTRIPIEDIFVPNTFSPNDDGINDTWGIPDMQYYLGGRVAVFERSGKRVFYTENPSFRWDGTFNGRELPVGTYFWVIEAKETDEIRRGLLNLIKK
jgi:gliding motility-associated-like protein